MAQTQPNQFKNGTFENAPTFVAASTTDNWMDGTAAGSATNDQYGWYLGTRATSVSAQFDSSKSRSGANSMKLSTLDATGRCRVFTAIAGGGNVNTSSSNLPYLIPAVAGGTYTFSGWAQCTNAAAGGVLIEIVELNGSGTVGTSTASNTISGTVGSWTNLTVTVSVASTCRYLVLDMQNATAGNISDAWFDDLVLTGPLGKNYISPNRGIKPHPFSPGRTR